MRRVGRLAPTPSGALHLGNVCAFAAAWLSTRAARGRLLLRLEDVDLLRARPEVEQSIRHDLTAVQISLWHAFGAAPPRWCHTPLVLGLEGRKLSKSHGAAGVAALRQSGWTPADVWRLVWPWLGLPPDAALDTAVALFDPAASLAGPIVVDAPAGQSCPRPGEIGWRTVVVSSCDGGDP